MVGHWYSYGTAQRQLDTCKHAAAWNFSCEDYIMRSIFEWAPVTFVLTSGKLSGMCTGDHSTHFENTFNINCIHMINLWTLSLYVPIDPWIDSPIEKLLTCNCVQYLIPYCLVCYRLVCYRLVWKMDRLLAIESPLTSLRLACQLVGSLWENMLAINIVCWCRFLICETE